MANFCSECGNKVGGSEALTEENSSYGEGMNENGFNENINESQKMLAQMVYLCAQKGKQNIIHFVEGASTLNDMNPRFSYRIFREI